MTLGQGHGKVIQYISPAHIFFVLDMYSLAQMVLTWGAKVLPAADVAVDATARNWKQKVNSE